MKKKTLATPNHATLGDTIDGVNWNDIEDEKDKEVWDRVVSNFWLPEAIPISNDIQSWKSLSKEQQWATMQVFTGLTFLDTIQGTVGAVSLLPDAVTQIEESVYCNFSFMEAVHAKSYSNIFMTLADTQLINRAFRWGQDNAMLQAKSHTILSYYKNNSRDLPEIRALKRKVASTMLESFMFYSGFYLPLRFSSEGKLTNTADMIKLIIRDEAVHGYYIGYKYQVTLEELSETSKESMKEFVFDFMYTMYDIEEEYTSNIYDPIGWTDDVMGFLRYNANKTLNNLGYENLFPADECRFHPGVLSSLNPGTDENHDFFSGKGSAYVIGDVEETTDDDWDF